MNVFQSLKRALASKTPTPSVELGKLIAQAASERDAARRRLESLRDADAEVALDDSKWKANGAAIADAEREVLRFDRVIAELQERLADAQAAEATVERKRRYAEADARANEIAASIDGRLAKIARETQALLRDVATAQRAVDAVNADLPDGAGYLTGVELRGRSVLEKPFRSERRKVKAWVEVSSGHVRGREVPGLQVDPDDPTIGYVSGSGRKLNFNSPRPYSFEPAPNSDFSHGFNTAVQKFVLTDVYEVIEFANEKAAYTPTPLASSIALPPVRHAYGEPAAWKPLHELHASPDSVLQHLDWIAAEAAKADPINCASPPQPVWTEVRRYLTSIGASE
ncbi:MULTISPECIES: hypothetical protein [unclassified Chelatococcus]|uniref:hypothetical protein n=1 Tax=unclassified Chelatococcus TaxID=2638111 RepID=UPI001BCBD3C6|nr:MULTISPECIES: hypothetical protein [unclassified Chelatococcus]MBS7698685.1 hypothetical protein [Chelatococcus sp. YT9]MBX3554733.1 hypothetical protein [Chelatococcus sp.]